MINEANSMMQSVNIHMSKRTSNTVEIYRTWQEL